jgi:hypothetical protein
MRQIPALGNERLADDLMSPMQRVHSMPSEAQRAEIRLTNYVRKLLAQRRERVEATLSASSALARGGHDEHGHPRNSR